MNDHSLKWFEAVVRSSSSSQRDIAPEHPFEIRGYAALFPEKVRRLYDDGHYSQASFEAYKFIEQILRDKSENASGFGVNLVNYALDGNDPRVKLDCPSGENYGKFRDNFQKMLVGAFGNIRNPKGHKLVDQGPDECLDELTMAAYFIRIVDPPSIDALQVMPDA